MPSRPCLDCGRLHRNPSRCDLCSAKREAARGSSTQRGYGAKWRATRQAVLDTWIDLYGHSCPGWQRPWHPATDLTVDHIRPKAKGGTDERVNLAVLCLSCNSAKRDRPHQAEPWVA